MNLQMRFFESRFSLLAKVPEIEGLFQRLATIASLCLHDKTAWQPGVSRDALELN